MKDLFWGIQHLKTYNRKIYVYLSWDRTQMKKFQPPVGTFQVVVFPLDFAIHFPLKFCTCHGLWASIPHWMQHLSDDRDWVWLANKYIRHNVLLTDMFLLSYLSSGLPLWIRASRCLVWAIYSKTICMLMRHQQYEKHKYETDIFKNGSYKKIKKAFLILPLLVACFLLSLLNRQA